MKNQIFILGKTDEGCSLLEIEDLGEDYCILEFLLTSFEMIIKLFSLPGSKITKYVLDLDLGQNWFTG